MEKEIKNAVISGTMLGYEDHGIMTCFVYLDYGGSGQGFGGYGFDSYDKQKEKRVSTAYGLAFIKGILDTLEVETWEELKGKYLRAEYDYGKVYKIGHPLKDKWFCPDTDLIEYLNLAPSS